MMKKYFVYLDDGKECFKVAVPAKDVAAAKKFVQGNGEIVAIKDVTDEYPISADKVHDALTKAGFGDVEIQLIVRTLTTTNIAE